MPPKKHIEYYSCSPRDPPILRDVFTAHFYGCNKACIKAQLDILSIVHGCSGRNHCGKYRYLARLPRKRTKWDVGSDEETEEAWGINALYRISFIKVVFYHLLILVGPIIFWGLWLRRWPRDWQNASVPFFAVVVLLSLFWLPLVHNAKTVSSGAGTKIKME